MSSSDDGSQERFALGFVFALIALIVSAVVGTVVVRSLGDTRVSAAGSDSSATAAASAGAVPGAVAAGPVAGSDAAVVVVDSSTGVVKFYFASGDATLAAGANDALADVVKGTAEGRKAVVSGFHDATGDAAQNAELAKQRAQAVQAALLALGVPEDRVELRKPEQALATAAASSADARRVEVVLSAP